MRRILLTLGFLALTVSLGAQQPTPSRIGLKRVAAPKGETIGNVSHFSGGVKVWVGTALVTADEAFINHETEEIEFRGNVRLKASSDR